MRTTSLPLPAFKKNRLLGAILFSGIISNYGYSATVTFDATITARGTETSMVEKTVWGDMQSIDRFEGCALGGACARPKKTIDSPAIDIPAQYSDCIIDTSKGNQGPGLSVHVSSMNSPGGDAYQYYSLDTTTRRFTYGVTVTALRSQGAWYQASYNFHLKCPGTANWTQTQTKSFTADSKNGYGFIADYTGPIGSGSGTNPVVDDNLFEVKISNLNPANADFTAGMFKTTPAQLSKGPKLFAHYQPTHVTSPQMKSVTTGNNLNHGSGVTIGDINGNGIEDILLLSNDELPEGNDFTYQIGWDIDTNLNPKQWSPLKRTWGMGWAAQGTSAALYRATTAGAPLEAVLMTYDKNDTVTTNEFRYRYGVMDANGDFAEKGSVLLPGVDKYVKGAGVELYDLDNNGRPEIILSATRAQASGGLHYRIGWNLDPLTGQAASWTNGVVGNFGFSPSYVTGGGVAIANLDRNPAADIVFTYLNQYDYQAYTITGWNLQANGQPLEWGMPIPTGVTFPDTTADLDIAIYDMDVAGRVAQRGALPIEKSLVITGTDAVAGIDPINVALVRHSNSRDLIANGNFDTNIASWAVWGVNGVFYEQGSLCGSNGHVGANPWTAGFQTREAIPLVMGKNYKVQFDLWSPANAQVGVKVGNQLATLVYGQNLALAVKAGWNRYTFNFSMSAASDYNARLEFFLGTSAAPTRACVDNVRLYNNVNTANDFSSFPGDASANLARNSLFDYGTLAGWAVKSYAAEGVSTKVRIKNNEACVKVPASATWWAESLVQNNIRLESGATYDVSFEAYANVAAGSALPLMVLKAGKDSTPFTTYFQQDAIALSAQKTAYSYSFTMSGATDEKAGLAFFMGNNMANSEVCLDKISLIKR